MMCNKNICSKKIDELENKYSNLKSTKNTINYIMNRTNYDYDNEEERILDIYKTLINFKECENK